jgi:hypothetical protein
MLNDWITFQTKVTKSISLGNNANVNESILNAKK